MKTLNKLIALFVITLFTTSCIINGVVGSRNVTTESRTIEANFTGIKVSQGIEVQLTQDTEVSLSAEFDNNLHELLITKVEDGILKIYFEENVSKRKSSTIYLTMPKISEITTSSGAEVTAKNTLKVNELIVDSSSGSQIDIRVEANSIESNSSSGSQIDIKGTSENLVANASSGSNIDADELLVKNVFADASSGSSIDVQATESITAKASSGASIECKGNPKERDVQKSSGGNVSVN